MVRFSCAASPSSVTSVGHQVLLAFPSSLWLQDLHAIRPTQLRPVSTSRRDGRVHTSLTTGSSFCLSFPIRAASDIVFAPAAPPAVCAGVPSEHGGTGPSATITSAGLGRTAGFAENLVEDFGCHGVPLISRGDGAGCQPSAATCRGSGAMPSRIRSDSGGAARAAAPAGRLSPQAISRLAPVGRATRAPIVPWRRSGPLHPSEPQQIALVHERPLPGNPPMPREIRRQRTASRAATTVGPTAVPTLNAVRKFCLARRQCRADSGRHAAQHCA